MFNCTVQCKSTRLGRAREGSRSSLPSTSSVFLNRAFFNRMKRHHWAPTASAPPHHHLKVLAFNRFEVKRLEACFTNDPEKKKKKKKNSLCTFLSKECYAYAAFLLVSMEYNPPLQKAEG